MPDDTDVSVEIPFAVRQASKLRGRGDVMRLSRGEGPRSRDRLGAFRKADLDA